MSASIPDAIVQIRASLNGTEPQGARSAVAHERVAVAPTDVLNVSSEFNASVVVYGPKGSER